MRPKYITSYPTFPSPDKDADSDKAFITSLATLVSFNPTLLLPVITVKSCKMAATHDNSKPFFPLAGQAKDGWSTENEATATCFCGAVQLSFVSRHWCGRRELRSRLGYISRPPLLTIRSLSKVQASSARSYATATIAVRSQPQCSLRILRWRTST
jgi:hypothetical protein